MNANDIIEKCAGLLDSLSSQEIRLHLGEMTAQEMRSVRAAFIWKAGEIRALKSPFPAETSGGMTEAQIKYLVDRFLQWRLPEDFNPDAGISYKRPNYAAEVDATPTGTNLFDAAQATDMVRFMVEGMPASSLPAETVSEAMVEAALDVWYPIEARPELTPTDRFGAYTRSQMRQALEAAALAHADDGWRPIESAPKDGTGILVWIKGAKLPFTARWSVARNRWVDMQNDESVYPSPAHWRPLPAPPKDRRE